MYFVYIGRWARASVWWRFCCSYYYHTDMLNTNVQLNAHISNKYALCLCIYSVFIGTRAHNCFWIKWNTSIATISNTAATLEANWKKKLPYDYARCSSQMRTEKKEFKLPTKSSKNCVNIQAQISLNFVYLFFLN